MTSDFDSPRSGNYCASGLEQSTTLFLKKPPFDAIGNLPRLVKGDHTPNLSVGVLGIRGIGRSLQSLTRLSLSLVAREIFDIPRIPRLHVTHLKLGRAALT
jgi:hypothetical protein